MQLYWIIVAVIVGLLVGSFLNVVIYRLPLSLMKGWRKECQDFLREDTGVDFPETTDNDKPFNIAFPGSHCPSCKAAIPAWCNVPLFSYLLLRGRCLKCQTHISLRYPFVELLSGITTGYIVANYGLTIEAAALAGFCWVLICLTFIDIDHQLLPDSLTLPLLWAGLVINASTQAFTDLHSALYGAVFGYLSLWSVYWLFKLATGKDGIGFGDFKLLSALGAWMGWQMLPLIVILSATVGAISGIAMIILSGQEKSKPIPFGPYLAIAGIVAFFWGEHLLRHYLHMFALS